MADLSQLKSQDYFLPYQLKWINDNSRMKIYEKTRRRGGMTYSTSYRCHKKCMDKPGHLQWVSSRDELTAKQFISEYIAKWCGAAKVLATGLMGESQDIFDGENSVKAFIAEYPNGSKIVSLSSNPHAFAGKGGDILLDECDLHKNQADLIAMAMPCITWGGQIEIVSAYDPMGSVDTPYAEMVQEIKDGERDGWSLHSTNIFDAVEDGLAYKIATVTGTIDGRSVEDINEAFLKQIRNSCRTERDFNSQYACIPNSSSGSTAISASDLLAAKIDIPEFEFFHVIGDAKVTDQIDPSVQELMDKKIWERIFRDNHRYSLGYDVARRGDLSTLPVFKGVGSVRRMVALIILENCKFYAQEMFIRQAFEFNKQLVGGGDETGLGMHVCENLHTAYSDRFLPLNFASMKPELGTTMTEGFETHTVHIPSDHPEIAADFKCVETTTTPSGRLSYSAAQNKFLPQSHADIAWGGAIGLYAFRELKPKRAMAYVGSGETSKNNLRPDNSDDFKYESSSKYDW